MKTGFSLIFGRINFLVQRLHQFTVQLDGLIIQRVTQVVELGEQEEIRTRISVKSSDSTANSRFQRVFPVSTRQSRPHQLIESCNCSAFDARLDFRRVDHRQLIYHWKRRFFHLPETLMRTLEMPCAASSPEDRGLGSEKMRIQRVIRVLKCHQPWMLLFSSWSGKNIFIFETSCFDIEMRIFMQMSALN